MPSKDYYVILGITPEETQNGVRSAWRDLARKHHPDRAGRQSTRRFQEVSEAYNVLGDPRRRAEYDRSRRATAEATASPPAGAWEAVPVEPFDPGSEAVLHRRSAPEVNRRWSILRDFIAPYSAFDEVVDRFRRNFSDEWLPKSSRLEALNLGLHLSREEARRGGSVELGVPVFFPCPNCRGTGRRSFFHACSVCRQSGTISRDEPVQLHIPAGVADGTLFEIPLKGLGIRNIFLRVLIRVGN
jgi:molecular chaperone DnaJ